MRCSTASTSATRRSALRDRTFACTDTLTDQNRSAPRRFSSTTLAHFDHEQSRASVARADMPQTRVEGLEALVARMREKLATTSEKLATTSEKLTTTSEKLATTSEKLAGVISERDNLRRAYQQLMEQFELLRRRIFIAKAERVDASQLELEFAATEQKLGELAEKLSQAGDSAAGADAVGSRPSSKPASKPEAKPKGRRTSLTPTICQRPRRDSRPGARGQGQVRRLVAELQARLPATRGGA